MAYAAVWSFRFNNSDGLRAVAFVSDVTSRKHSRAAMPYYQKRLQRLTESLIQAHESANRTLARELHDVFSQELAAVAMEISLLRESVEGSASKERLTQLGKKIGRLANEMHRTSRQLHPAILEELGLEAALREECNTFSQQSAIPVQFESESLPSLPVEVSLCLYRVAQESLRNIRKHVGATSASVRLKGVDGAGLKLMVEDKGGGFDVNEARKRGGLGLISMEERVRALNGQFTITSAPGTGTTIEVLVPLNRTVE